MCVEDQGSESEIPHMGLCSERHGIDGDMVLRVQGNGGVEASFLSSYWWTVKTTPLLFWLVCSAR